MADKAPKTSWLDKTSNGLSSVMNIGQQGMQLANLFGKNSTGAEETSTNKATDAHRAIADAAIADNNRFINNFANNTLPFLQSAPWEKPNLFASNTKTETTNNTENTGATTNTTSTTNNTINPFVLKKN